MSIRQETSSSSWSLSFRSEIRMANSQFRSAAILTQTGQVVKSHGSQPRVHWFRCSTSIFSQQAGLKHQLLIHQRKASSMRWLKHQLSHLRSRISFRSSIHRFFHLRSALSFRQTHQPENQWLQDSEFQGDQNTSSSSIYGLRMRSRRANSSSRRSELISIPQTFSQNMFQLQFLVSIFLVSTSSRFLSKDQNQFFCQHTQVNQFSVHPTHSHPQHQRHLVRRRRCQSSCSLSTLIIKSIFVRDSGKHQEASKEFSHLLVEGAEIKNQMLFVVSMSVSKDQMFKRIKIQKSEIQIQVFMLSSMFLLRIKSRRVSGVHGSDHASACQCHWDHCHGEGKVKKGIRRIRSIKKESINDYHIFISVYQESCHMSCSIQCSAVLSFSCSILCIRQISHQFRSQVLSPLSLKPSSTQVQSQSSLPQHHLLHCSQSPHHCHQWSWRCHQRSSQLMMQHQLWQVSLKCQMTWSWYQQIQSSSSTIITVRPSSQRRSRQTSQCQGSRSVQRQIPHHHWSNMRSLHHFHQRGWTCVICQRMSRCSHHASKLVQTCSTSSSSWTQRISASGSSSMMRSSSSGISIMFFKFLESRIHQEVISSTGSFISHFRMPSITWSTSQWLIVFVMDHWHHHQICQRHIQLCQVSCFQVTFSSLRKKICSGSSHSTSCQVLPVIFVSHRSWIRFRSSEHLLLC